MTVQQWAMAVALLPLLYVTGECAARWWIRYRDRYYVLPPGLRLRLRLDRDVFPQMECETRFDVNADGERGGEVPRPANGVYRVLVGGGSQPEGFLLDQDTAWPGALQRLLDQPASLAALGARQVHVGSIARSGVGSEALDLIFDRVLPRYPRLQLIVILIGATDVLRWLEHDASRALPPVKTADVFRCHPEGPFAWKPQGTAMWEIVLRARRRWLRPIVVHERAGKWIGEARAMRARATEIRHAMPDARHMIDQFDFYFQSVLDKAAAHADRVIVVRQPWFDKELSSEEAAHMWHGGAGQVWRREVDAYYSFDVVARLMALVDNRAATIARSRGVEQVDLMPVVAPSLENYYDGFHATPVGAGKVAAAIAAAILGQPAAAATTTRQEPSQCVDLLAS